MLRFFWLKTHNTLESSQSVTVATPTLLFEPTRGAVTRQKTPMRNHHTKKARPNDSVPSFCIDNEMVAKRLQYDEWSNGFLFYFLNKKILFVVKDPIAKHMFLLIWSTCHFLAKWLLRVKNKHGRRPTPHIIFWEEPSSIFLRIKRRNTSVLEIVVNLKIRTVLRVLHWQLIRYRT